MYGKKKHDRFFEKDEDDTDRGLFRRFVEGTILFLVCCYLIKMGVMILLSVRVPLIIIAVVVGIIFIVWRSYRWRKHRDDY